MNKRLTADLILFGISALWGATFVLVQNAIAILPPYSFLMVRFGLGVFFLLPFLLIGNQDGFKIFTTRRLIISGLLLGIWLFAGYAFQTLGLLYTTSSKAGFITGLSVVLVPVFSLIILRHSVTPSAIAGVILAAIGLYNLTLGESLSINIGDVLVFFCAISFALHIVFTGKFAGIFEALPLTIIQLCMVTILSLVFALATEDMSLTFTREVIFNPHVLSALIITSLFATSLAFLAQTKFQRFTTPTRVALIFAMEPVFAAITGVLFANESLGIKEIIGCTMIFAGMILSELPTETFGKLFRKIFSIGKG